MRGPAGVIVRPAVPADAAFLSTVLAIAADWRDDDPRPAEEVLSDGATARYVSGWPAPGDVGFVAELDGEAIGACWWRFLAGDERGYGHVDDTIPEITIGVLSGHRGHGAGSTLLGALVSEARANGIPALSLSVEPDNPAVTLYRRAGFVTVGAVGGAVTMLLRTDRGG